MGRGVGTGGGVDGEKQTVAKLGEILSITWFALKVLVGGLVGGLVIAGLLFFLTDFLYKDSIKEIIDHTVNRNFAVVNATDDRTFARLNST